MNIQQCEDETTTDQLRVEGKGRGLSSWKNETKHEWFNTTGKPPREVK